jgi:hypothetical protein
MCVCMWWTMNWPGSSPRHEMNKVPGKLSNHRLSSYLPSTFFSLLTNEQSSMGVETILAGETSLQQF